MLELMPPEEPKLNMAKLPTELELIEPDETVKI